MKIATFNINGVNRRLPNLLDWLAEAEPDVVYLQELKATDRQFPRAAVEDAGYGAVGTVSRHGMVLLSSLATPSLS
jgi:exodeoxyribonuclease-3